ncbi:MAG TPA: DUF1598 domain-containing protein [Pirellulales bacterium]|jgi:hypothetical protein|nr:DUF1598 domain-containing protein [Pirellulales bacterium]
MRFIPVRTVGWLALACLLTVWASGPSTRGAQADRVSDELLAAQVASGEFVSALGAAGKIANPERRDQWLARIAAAQAKAGTRAASYNTLAAVQDDRIRAAALKEPEKPGAQGGANFQQLIQLITDTIAPTTWDEVGGPGAISSYVAGGGVYVDAEGMVRRTVRKAEGSGLAVARLEAIESRTNAHGKSVGKANTNPRAQSALRKISLTRLEKQVQLRVAAGRRPTEEMFTLAGLEKIQYVFVYPETGDVVLAGPAGAWRPDQEGRVVSQTSGRPVLQLDDLVVVLRHMLHTVQGQFGCSINPREDALAKTKTFLDESAKTPLKVGAGAAWLKQLRDRMGKQDIVVNGIDPRTRVAQVLVEADYRMKLVGMGIEPGVTGVQSYLASMHVPRGETPPPLDVLRWWFTLNDQDIRASEGRDAFELANHGVRVQSENELLSALGQRVHTGKSEPLNQQFAQSFTEHFAALATKYPIYADLENIFDLALVGALIKSQDLSGRANWHLTCFGDSNAYPVMLRPAPKTVETVINHRVINQVHIVAGVSGGVSVNPWHSVSAEALQVDKAALPGEHRYAAPEVLPSTAWWWD